MNRWLHDYWPVAVVTLFTTLLVLQIPRKALFPSADDASAPVEAFASFVEYEDDAYDALVQKVRMSWQVRTRNLPGGEESRTGAFDFNEPLPPPSLLPLPTVLADTPAADAALRPMEKQLFPPSRALSGTEGLASASEPKEPQRLRAELLELPDSLVNNQ